MPELAPVLWLVLPLGIAAGLDLYLTLLLLALAPSLPWWDHPLPGGLGDLNAFPIIGVVAVMYVAEVMAERRPATYLAWNATHAFIRPVSGALLAALLLHGSSTSVLVSGAVAGGLVAFLAHAVRSGGVVLRALDPGPGPSSGLVGILEDVLVLGLVTASLDAPGIALGGAAMVAMLGLPRAASRVRVFAFTTRLAAARVFQAFRQRRWIPTEELPRRVREALAGDTLATGGGLRGARVGVVGLRGCPRFARGWLVMTGGRPVFLPRSGGGAEPFIELGGLTPRAVVEERFHRTVDLEYEQGALVRLLFFVDGPAPPALAADFGLVAASAPVDPAQENL